MADTSNIHARSEALHLFSYLQAHTSVQDRPEYSPATITGLHEALNAGNFTGHVLGWHPETILCMLAYFQHRPGYGWQYQRLLNQYLIRELIAEAQPQPGDYSF